MSELIPLPSPEVLESLSPISPEHIHDNPTYHSPDIESAEYVGKLPGNKFFHVHVYYVNSESPMDFPFNYEESALDFYCNL